MGPNLALFSGGCRKTRAEGRGRKGKRGRGGVGTPLGSSRGSRRVLSARGWGEPRCGEGREDQNSGCAFGHYGAVPVQPHTRGGHRAGGGVRGGKGGGGGRGDAARGDYKSHEAGRRGGGMRGEHRPGGSHKPPPDPPAPHRPAPLRAPFRPAPRPAPPRAPLRRSSMHGGCSRLARAGRGRRADTRCITSSGTTEPGSWTESSAPSRWGGGAGRCGAGRSVRADATLGCGRGWS